MGTRKANFRRSPPWTKGSLYEIGILFCKRFTKTRVPSNSPWKGAKWTNWIACEKNELPRTLPIQKGLSQEKIIGIGIGWPKGRIGIWNFEILKFDIWNWKFGIWKLIFGNWKFGNLEFGNWYSEIENLEIDIRKLWIALKVEIGNLKFGFWNLVFEIGSWTLEIGNWKLEIGNW